MKEKFKYLLRHPSIEGDEKKVYEAKLLNLTILATLLFIILSLIDTLFDGNTHTSVFIIESTMIAVFLLLRYLLFKDQVSLAGKLLIIFGIILITIDISGRGTIRTPGITAYVLAVIVAGLLYGKKGLIFSILSSSLIVLGLIFVENAGMLPQPNYSVNITQWITYSLIFGLTGYLIYYTYQSLHNTIYRISEDITKRKIIEENFTAIVESTHDGIVVIQNDVIIFANKPTTEMYGASLSKIIGHTLLEFVHKDSIEMVKKHYEDKRNGKKVHNKFKVDLINSTKEKRTCEISYSNITFNDKPSELVVIHDITERKIVEENLRTSERRLALAVEGAHLGLWDQDFVSGKIIRNERWAQMLGYKLSEIEQNRSAWRKLIHPDDLAQLNKNIKLHEQGKISNYSVEHRMRTKDGEWKWIHNWGKIVERDKLGKPLRAIGVHLDINVRKIAEISLLRNKEKAEKYLNIAAGIIISLDKKGNITLLNDKGSKLLGYKPGELIGKNWFDVSIPKSINKEIKSVFKQLMKGDIENVTNFENNVITKNGDEKTIYWHNTLIYDDENKISGFLSSGEDITERKHVELELKKLSTSVEQSPVSIVITDIEGNIEYVNPYFEKLTGYSVSEAINQNPRVLKSGLTPNQVFKDLWSTIKDGKIWSGELINKKKNGDIYTESAVIAPIFNEDGVITQYTAVKTDITDRKKVETDLRRSEESFRGLFNSASDAIYIQDHEGRFLDVNEAVIKMYGYPKEFFIGKTPEFLSAPGKNDLNKIAKHISKAFKIEPQQFEFWGLRSDGEVFPKIVHLQKGKYFDQDVLIAFATDITKRKRMETKILDYQNNLRLMTNELSKIEEREKRELAYKLHDVIGQSMAMAKIKLGEISKDMSFEDVQSNIDMAKSLVVDAIKKSRDLTYELSPPILYELGLVAAIKWYSEQISKLYNIKIQIKGVKESLGCSEEIKIIIYRSIAELLNNIVKYSHATKAVIAINKFNNHGRITVSDNGQGFDSDNMLILTKSKKFGLFSIKERIEYIGGEFNIKSKINVGTTATIKIAIGK